MPSTITLEGQLIFDPPNVSRKHSRQGAWKAVAVLAFPGEDALYYSWFIRRRYGLPLVKPLRGSHVTFVNDKSSHMAHYAWDRVRASHGGRRARVTLSLDPRSNGAHWWLPATDATELMDVRTALGLRRVPHWPMHMTIGLANERNAQYSEHLRAGLACGLVP